MIVSADLAQLAGLARLEAQRQPPRSPERRAASHLLYALSEPPAKSVASARNAIASFGTPQTQADALALLHQLAATTTTTTEGTPS